MKKLLIAILVVLMVASAGSTGWSPSGTQGNATGDGSPPGGPTQAKAKGAAAPHRSIADHL